MRDLPRGAAAPVENERLTTLARRLAAATLLRDAVKRHVSSLKSRATSILVS
jgi:hypothetical protein